MFCVCSALARQADTKGEGHRAGCGWHRANHRLDGRPAHHVAELLHHGRVRFIAASQPQHNHVLAEALLCVV